MDIFFPNIIWALKFWQICNPAYWQKIVPFLFLLFPTYLILAAPSVSPVSNIFDTSCTCLYSYKNNIIRYYSAIKRTDSVSFIYSFQKQTEKNMLQQRNWVFDTHSDALTLYLWNVVDLRYFNLSTLMDQKI